MMTQLSDAYSVEVYCRNSAAIPSALNRPLGFLNGYGFGLQMNTKGNIGYTTTTQGNKADGTFDKTQWSWIGEGTLTDEYTHYVIVYDRVNYRSQLYVNGALADTRWLTFKECPVYEWTPSTWLAIGGDARGNYDAATQTGTYPFMGDIATVRIYGKALNQSQVSELASILNTQEKSFTVGNNGYVGVCLPYVWMVPEGCTAFIVSAIDSPSIMLKPIAQAGELVPYGTPVILKGIAKAVVTLTAEDKQTFGDEIVNYQSSIVNEGNLLAGTYPGKTLAAGEGYYLRATGTSTNLYRASTNVTLPAFSCYLPSAEKRSSFSIVEEESTGINAIENVQLTKDNDGAVYDLTGRQIVNRKLSRGIYIVNGKKVLR
jgi:hypothetical protein